MGLIFSILLMVLLFFAAVDFGAAEPWSQLIIYSFVYTGALALLFKRHRIYMPKVGKIITGLLLFLLLLCFIQAARQRTILDPKTLLPFTLSSLYTMQAAGRILCALSLFYIVTNAIESSKYIRFLLAMTVVCGLYAIAAALMYSGWQYSYFFSGFKTISFGPFINRNHAAIFLSMSFFASLALFLPSLIKSELRFTGQEVYKRILFAFILMVLAFGVISTRSRGGIIAFIFGLLLLGIMLSLYLIQNRRSKLMACGATIMLGTVLAFAGIKYMDIFNQFAQRMDGVSVSIRKILYQTGFNMLGDYPLTGVGYDAFAVGSAPYFPEQIKAYAQRLHSDWFELALSIGIPLFIVTIICICIVLILLIKRIKALEPKKQIMFCSILAGLLSFSAGCIIDFHFHLTINSMIFFIFAGILCCEAFWHEQIKPFKLPFILKLMMILPAAICLYFSFIETSAWRKVSFALPLKNERQIPLYQSALQTYPLPRYALRLSTTYYNASIDRKTPADKAAQYRQKAAEISEEYLKKYPKDKQLSNIYLLTH